MWIVCRLPAVAIMVGLLAASMAWAHDIPNQRVDRSIQATLRPGHLTIDYDVSLTELTLTQDLRSLIGSLPGADRAEWLARYAEVTGPLNAKGLLVAIDGQQRLLVFTGHEVVVEEHPRYTFHFETDLPVDGQLSIRDTNFASSEGTSRLAIRGREGIIIEGDDRPADVDQIPIQPVWQLDDQEEIRTKVVNVWFSNPSSRGRSVSANRSLSKNSGSDREPRGMDVRAGLDRANTGPRRLSEFLNSRSGVSWLVMGAIAVFLGAAHAVQPGHGKTLVTAVALRPEGGLSQAILLGFSATISHLGSVLMVALALWFTGATEVATIHRGLSQVAGFAIAAAGLWRIGRYLGGHGGHASDNFQRLGSRTWGIIGLGLASGVVPCWDAVGLLVLAATLGRLGAGVALVVAFSLGMAVVLAAVAWLAWRMKSSTVGFIQSATWQRRLEVICGLMLAAVGLFLFFD